MEGEGILGGCKVKKEVLEMIKKEFHRKVITIAVFEENQQSEEPRTITIESKVDELYLDYAEKELKHPGV